jgi:hypothetical protein
LANATASPSRVGDNTDPIGRPGSGNGPLRYGINISFGIWSPPNYGSRDNIIAV